MGGALLARALYSGRADAAAITLQKKSGYLHMLFPLQIPGEWIAYFSL